MTDQKSKEDRQIRIFISSTFRDMQVERELLVKHVFPELRRICAERFVTFTEVDLRWGITEEQAAEGRVLPICLEEIHRCRPYFIGLLGERYGWIPETVPTEVIEREPWLREHVGGHTSVTELEILHGVLNNPDMADHAFFYFRDPAYVSSIPDKDRKDFIEDDEGKSKKLKKLKEGIRNSGLPVLENYANPNVMAEAVRERLLALIDQLYPKEEVPDPLDQESMGHESYGWDRLQAYVERPEQTAEIDAFAEAESTSQGLVITGESGGGKTALLASWVLHWRKKHPDDFVFAHYFGATPESASVDRFLRRLLGELKRRFDIPDEIPSESDNLREALSLWLAQTVGKGQIVLVLDALNQIEGGEPDRCLAWLPRYFSAHLRVIASSLPGISLDALMEREWREYKLPLPDLAERLRMIRAFMGYHRKILRRDLFDQIASARACSNPLFLRTVLEELRQFGSFEQLPHRVAHYLEAESPESLFRLVLRRWEEDFSDGQDLVRRAFCHLWAARQGLAETEWLELLGTEDQTLPRQIWTPFFLAMERHLSQRSGLWIFGHDFLRQAVQEEFLSLEKERQTAHIELADYFENSGDIKRKTKELPWQLKKCSLWHRLAECLLDWRIFDHLNSDFSRYELLDYWQSASIQTGLMEQIDRVYAAMKETLPNKADESFLANSLGSFFMRSGYYASAEVVMRKAVEIVTRELGADHITTANHIFDLANLYWIMRDYSSAEEKCRKAIELLKNHQDTNLRGYAVSCGLLGKLLEIRNDIDGAEKQYTLAIDLLEKSFGKGHHYVASAMNDLAMLLYKKGNTGIAEEMLNRALNMFEKTLGRTHPYTTIAQQNVGIMLYYRKELEGALKQFLYALNNFEKLYGPDIRDLQASSCLNNLGRIYFDMGDLDRSKHYYGKLLDIYEALLGENHPDTKALREDLNYVDQAR